MNVGKRLTETNKWRDAYFRELSPDAKLAYLYMLDACDGAGVYDPDWRLANFSIGRDIAWDEILDELGNRVRKLTNGKIFLTRFIRFQYNELTPASAPHRSALALLERHGIALKDAYYGGPDDLTEEPPKLVQIELDGIKPKRERTRDLVFEALAEINGADIGRLTVAERGRLNNAAAAIRKVEPDVTPERVNLAAKNWKKKGFSAPASASVIASRWSELTPKPETQMSRNERDHLRAKLAAAKAKLEPLMDDSGAVPFPKDGLTEEQIAEVKHLKRLIPELERQLG